MPRAPLLRWAYVQPNSVVCWSARKAYLLAWHTYRSRRADDVVAREAADIASNIARNGDIQGFQIVGVCVHVCTCLCCVSAEHSRYFCAPSSRAEGLPPPAALRDATTDRDWHTNLRTCQIYVQEQQQHQQQRRLCVCVRVCVCRGFWGLARGGCRTRNRPQSRGTASRLSRPAWAPIAGAIARCSAATDIRLVCTCVCVCDGLRSRGGRAVGGFVDARRRWRAGPQATWTRTPRLWRQR